MTRRKLAEQFQVSTHKIPQARTWSDEATHCCSCPPEAQIIKFGTCLRCRGLPGHCRTCNEKPTSSRCRAAGDCMPQALADAAAASLALVSTPVGAIPEIVHDGCNGLLVPVGSPTDARDTPRRLAATQACVTRWTRESLALARREHNAMVNHRRIFDLMATSVPIGVHYDDSSQMNQLHEHGQARVASARASAGGIGVMRLGSGSMTHYPQISSLAGYRPCRVACSGVVSGGAS